MMCREGVQHMGRHTCGRARKRPAVGQHSRMSRSAQRLAGPQALSGHQATSTTSAASLGSAPAALDLLMERPAPTVGEPDAASALAPPEQPDVAAPTSLSDEWAPREAPTRAPRAAGDEQQAILGAGGEASCADGESPAPNAEFEAACNLDATRSKNEAVVAVDEINAFRTISGQIEPMPSCDGT